MLGWAGGWGLKLVLGLAGGRAGGSGLGWLVGSGLWLGSLGDGGWVVSRPPGGGGAGLNLGLKLTV